MSRIAVLVDVRHLDAHPGLLPAVVAVGEAVHHAVVDEGSVVQIAVVLVRRRVVGHQDVGPSVAVDVGRGHAEPEPAAIGEDPGLPGDIGEGPVAVVVIQDVHRARETVWPAHHRQAAEGAGRVRVATPRDLGRVEGDVVDDVQIEQAVVVVIQESGAGAVAVVIDPRLVAHVGECSVAVVAIQMVGAPGSDVQIGIAVVVVVGGRGPETPERGGDPRGGGHLAEFPVPFVAVEIGERLLARLDPLDHRTVGDIDVEISVAIVVEHRRAAAERVDDPVA